MKIRAFAPGKLVLLGEYAVLAGAPAVVTAIDRYASVTLSPSSQPWCTVVAPGWRPTPVRCLISGEGEIEWLDHRGADDFSLLPAIIKMLVSEGQLQPQACPPWSAVLETKDFFCRDNGSAVKLGLGSSAALAVSLAAALAAWNGNPSSFASPGQLTALLRAHRNFQNGHGSGLDVAAAVRGGTLEFRIGPPAQTRALELPAGVVMGCVWTRRTASTSKFLASLERWRRTDTARYDCHMERMGAVSACAVSALEAANAGRFLQAVADYTEALASLGSDASLDIFSSPHQHIARLAGAQGVVYKPSGAGGGDIGVAFAQDGARLDRFTKELHSVGYPTLALRSNAGGVETTIQETLNANAGI